MKEKYGTNQTIKPFYFSSYVLGEEKNMLQTIITFFRV